MTYIANLAYNAVISYIVVNILKIYHLIYDIKMALSFIARHTLAGSYFRLSTYDLSTA